MSSQQRRHRKASRFALRQVFLVAGLVAVLVAAIAGVSVLTSQANASSKAGAPPAASPRHGKGGKGTSHADPSASAPAAPPAAGTPAGGGAPSSTPAEQLPPVNLPSPSASATDTASAAPPAAETSASAAPAIGPSTGTAPVTDESKRVGALFSNSVAAGNHFCTASVVHSATRNLLLTAAHCLDSANGVLFAPGYRNGQAPYGTWQVTKIYTATGWTQSSDQDEDFAFLQVAPSNGKQIEDVVGADPLGTDAGFTATVRLYGYPDSGDVPLLCTNATTQQATYQRRIDCPSYSAGTSGGPWISTTTGAVIGVIGGYQQGGNTDDISYSSYFDHTIADLYQTAVSSAG